MLRSTVSRGIKFKLLLSVDTRPHQRSPYAASLQYARMRRRQLRGTPRCTTEHLLSDRKGPAGLSLQVYPLRKRQRVVQVYAEISDSAVHLRVTEQKLNGPQVAGLLVDLRNLRPAHRVGPVSARLETYRCNPATEDAGILPRRQMHAVVQTARP